MNILTSRLNLTVFSIFLLLSAFTFSQNKIEPSCGTISSTETIAYYKSISAELKKHEQDFLSSKYNKGPVPTTSINSIPVKAHVIRRSDGSGGLSQSSLNNAITNLNNQYADAYLEFFLCDGINYIDDDSLYHFKKENENTLTETHYVSGLINIYFTDYIENDSEQSICGYSDNMGRNDLVVINNSCALNNSSLAHELGHFFSLLHTHGPNNDTLTTELVNGSNCDTDGDGICDTPADPKLTNSNVDEFCNYIGSETDANGETFKPDTNNIMSYADKNCRTQFSPQQLARMYAFYMTTKNYLACSTFNANISVNESETCEESLTVNFESLSENITQWEWDIDADGVVDYTSKNPSHTYESGIYSVILKVSNKSKTIKKTFTNFIKVGTQTTLFDENFEDFDMLGNHGWTNNDVSGSGYLWYTNVGDTQSKTTGPTNYKKAEGGLNTYIYAEATGVNPGDIAEFISPCFTVNNENSELEFSYHMFGKHIGELHIDLKTEDGYINDIIPALYGSQQNNQEDAFLTKSINLSAYTNQTIKVRFRAVRGSSWDGDIAIDNIFIKTIDVAITDEFYKVYPNPVRDGIIFIKSNDPKRISTFEVSNLVGQTFLSGTVTNQPIDVSTLSSGTYLLILTNGDSRVLKRIIK
ncbi:T9SS-dependent choice-of-anchor J family protein [Flaviramulus aquimarinus]